MEESDINDIGGDTDRESVTDTDELKGYEIAWQDLEHEEVMVSLRAENLELVACLWQQEIELAEMEAHNAAILANIEQLQACRVALEEENNRDSFRLILYSVLSESESDSD